MKRITKAEMITKLSPLVEGLEQEGAKNMATMSPLTVAMYACKIRRLLDQWQPSERQSAKGHRARSSTARPNGASNNV